MKNIVTTICIILFSVSANCQVGSKTLYEESKKFEENKEYDKALSSIDKALKLDPQNHDCILQKARVLFFKKDCDGSFNLLKELIKREGTIDDEEMGCLCDITDCMGDKDEATEGLMEYVNSKKYKHGVIVLTLAIRLANAKRYDESISYYNQYLVLEPNDVDAMIDAARIVYAAKGSKEGVALLENYLRAKPNNTKLLNALGAFHFFGKDYEKALEAQNRLLAVEYNVENLNVRAKIFVAMLKMAAAYQDYKKIIEIDKCKVDLYSVILEYEYANQLFENLIATSNQLISCDKDYEEQLLDGLYTSMFFCGDFKTGKIYLDKKLAANPDNFNPYYTKAILLFKEKQYPDILKYLDLASKAKDIEPAYAKNLNLLEFAYYLIIEDYEKAANYWKSKGIQSSDTNISFKFIENTAIAKTQINTAFDRKSGIINSELTIPGKVLRLLQGNYGLKIDTEKNIENR
jgi:tetratricopeptide (TPR) repeat protein